MGVLGFSVDATIVAVVALDSLVGAGMADE